MTTPLYGGALGGGKSRAQLHYLFGNWIEMNFPPEIRPNGEVIALMWHAWQESHKIHLAGKEARIAELEERLGDLEANEWDRQWRKF